MTQPELNVGDRVIVISNDLEEGNQGLGTVLDVAPEHNFPFGVRLDTDLDQVPLYCRRDEVHLFRKGAL